LTDMNKLTDDTCSLRASILASDRNVSCDQVVFVAFKG
jgi:hypothetical protein